MALSCLLTSSFNQFWTGFVAEFAVDSLRVRSVAFCSACCAFFVCVLGFVPTTSISTDGGGLHPTANSTALSSSTVMIAFLILALALTLALAPCAAFIPHPLPNALPKIVGMQGIQGIQGMRMGSEKGGGGERGVSEKGGSERGGSERGDRITLTSTSAPLSLPPQLLLQFLATPAHWPEIVLSSVGVRGLVGQGQGQGVGKGTDTGAGVGMDVNAPLRRGDAVRELFGLPVLPLSVDWVCHSVSYTGMLYVCMYVCVYVCMCVCMYVCVCVYVMYVCMYVCM
jgi:hypothetical protein